jgi:hypothetical protein
MRTLAAVILVASLVPACAMDAESTQDSEVLGQMISHREQWSRPSRSEYQFTWQQGCFCGPEMTRPIRISVKAGRIVSAAYVDDKQPVSASIQSGLTTIEGVFDLIQHAVDQHYDEVRVTYGDQGYPSSVFFDISKRAADEERSIAISDVITAPAP